MNELRPCPWCGKPVNVIIYCGLYGVSCPRFGCSRKKITLYRDEQDAIEAWENGQIEDKDEEYDD